MPEPHPPPEGSSPAELARRARTGIVLVDVEDPALWREVLGGVAEGGRERGEAPVPVFGIARDPRRLAPVYAALCGADLADLALLYPGEPDAFFRHLPVAADLAVVACDGTRVGTGATLNALRDGLAAGAPLLLLGGEGAPARRAVEEQVRAGAYARRGSAGGAVLERGAGAAAAAARLPREVFAAVRDALYRALAGPEASFSGAVPRERLRDLTAPAREALSGASPVAGSGTFGRWPHDSSGTEALPPTLPGGRPWPRISIVTPSFNQGAYIEETIRSVAAQGYPDLEHIVIDGGSTDGTLAVLERHRSRLAAVVSEPDRGQSDAINKGFALATGDVLTWLNSDDMLAPGALAAVAMAFHASGADLVAGVCVLHRDGQVIDRHLTSCVDGEALSLPHLLDLDGGWNAGRFFYQPEVMFSRAIWERAGGRVEVTARYSMDYELWLRFAELGARVHVIGRPIAIFRVHDEQKTHVAELFREELKVVRDAFLARTGLPAPAPAPSPARRSTLRITFFNDHGFAQGAGIAHGRLAGALSEAGHAVTAVSARSACSDDAGDLPAAAVLERIRREEPDLVVLGNLHGANLTPDVALAIAREVPTAAVLHDFWMLTGKCPYPGEECGRYRSAEGCDDSCPELAAYPPPPREGIRAAWSARQDLLCQEPPILLLANSRWGEAVAGETLRARAAADGTRRPTAQVARIGLAFPLEQFVPLEKRTARRVLGIPEDRFYVMFSSSSLRDERKGLRFLERALGLVNIPGLATLCAGETNPAARPDLPELHALGYVRDPAKLALMYSAADLFVGPSRAETFGQVFVEAAACGTPSVGFANGGVAEAIVDGVTGFVVRDRDPKGLAGAIEELAASPQLRAAMGRWGRIHAENEWSMQAAAHRFHAMLFQTGLAGRLGLAPKLSFPVNAAAAPGASEALLPLPPGWTPVGGFGPWEGPHPDLKLPRMRWAYAPRASFVVSTDVAGPHLLAIESVNFIPGQRVELHRDDTLVATHEVPVSVEGRRHVLATVVTLAPGHSVVELRFGKRLEAGPEESRPLAMIVTGIACCPCE